MILTLAAAALTILSFSTTTDTTVAVSPGTRLSLHNLGGDIVVTTWAKNAVRVVADRGSRTHVELETTNGELTIKSVGYRGAPGAVDYEITAPAWMPLDLSAVYADISVSGTRADVTAHTVRGDVKVTGGKGFLSLQSVEGDVSLSGGSGRAEVSSVNADVSVTNHDGELSAESVNGDVVLEGVRSDVAEASTVNGTIIYEGELRNEGRYSFSTHNGDIVVALPKEPSASVSVSTYSGEFDSSFPVTLSESRRGKRFKFTLGGGSASLELESFQGAIRLYKSDDPRMNEVRQMLHEGREDPNPNPDPDKPGKHDKSGRKHDKTDKTGKDGEDTDEWEEQP